MALAEYIHVKPRQSVAICDPEGFEYVTMEVNSDAREVYFINGDGRREASTIIVPLNSYLTVGKSVNVPLLSCPTVVLHFEDAGVPSIILKVSPTTYPGPLGYPIDVLKCTLEFEEARA